MLRRTLALLTAVLLVLAALIPSPVRAAESPPSPCDAPEDLALLVSIAKPFGLAQAQDGSIYISDSRGHRVWRLTTDGRLVPFAGTGEKGNGGDGGQATLTSLNLPTGLAVAPDGSLYIAESGNHKVRKVAPNGMITTVAGKGADTMMGKNPDDSGDNGPAIQAGLNEPWGLALDAAGNLYIADSGNGKVRKVAPDGIITTAVGTSQFGAEYEEGILATDANLWGPTGVAVGPDGSLYVADPEFRRVFRVGSDRRISTFAGGGEDGGGTLAREVRLSAPSGLTVDAAGNVYISDTGSNLVRVVDPVGRIRTIAGSATALYLNDGGPATAARLSMPWGLLPDGEGGLYVADAEHFRVRRIDQTGRIETVAGNGVQTYPEDRIDLRGISPSAVAVASDGTIYYVDHQSYSGEIVRQRPDGSYGYLVTPMTQSANGIVIREPLALAVDPQDRLYVSMGDRIVRVEADGSRTHIAGNGAPGFAGDAGPAAEAAVASPVSMLFDPAGNLYFADAKNSRIRKITPDGIISTVAGNGNAGFGGDGGKALAASFNWPTDLAMDKAGNLYINDSNNYLIRKVTPGGIVSTVAGNGERYRDPEAGTAATKASLEVTGIQVDDAGLLYIATRERLFRLAPDGLLEQIAGHDQYGPLPELAPAAQVWLNRPSAMAKDARGNLYLSDLEAHRIWRLSPDGLMESVVGPMPYSKVRVPYMPSPWFEGPTMAVADGKGNVWVADTSAQRVYHVAPDGRARVLMEFNGPQTDYGVVVAIQLAGPGGLTLDKQGNLYVLGDNKVYKVTPAGKITVVAGSGEEQLSGDGGSALEAGVDPWAIAVADDGTIYLADGTNYRVRRVTPDGKITTYGGTARPGWNEGGVGDGGPATQAKLYANDIATDKAGNVYVASGSSVRKITPDGIISTVAGSYNSLAKPAEDGARARESKLEMIEGIAVDAQGTLYIAEGWDSRRILKVDRNGIITTVLGPAQGLDQESRLGQLSVDPAGNLWFAEPEKRRIRKVTPTGAVTTLSMREPAQLHPAAVARAEAQRAVVAQVAALQAGAPLTGEELVARLSETVRQRCAGASDAYVLSVLEAALRNIRVRQTSAVIDALALVYRGRGKIALALAVERARRGDATGGTSATAAKRIRLKVGDPNAEVDGKHVVLDVPPQIVDGRTLVPLRFLTESLGASLDWDDAEQRITITTLTQEVVLWVGRKVAVIGGVSVELDVPPQMISGRTMVPLRFVTENFGVSLDFDPEEMSIELTAKE